MQFFLLNKKMKTVKIKDKEFQLSITNDEIQTAIQRIANKINEELHDESPIFLGVLNGCFMFMSDLLKKIEIPCEVSFIKLSSYAGTSTTGSVKQILGLNNSIEGRTIVILEDIVDTGITMEHLLKSLEEYKPKCIKIATCLQKPDALQRDIKTDYVAINIPNEFIVGYGLDYDGFGRNLNEIYTIIKK